jgi:hypothetical protein
MYVLITAVTHATPVHRLSVARQVTGLDGLADGLSEGLLDGELEGDGELDGELD